MEKKITCCRSIESAQPPRMAVSYSVCPRSSQRSPAALSHTRLYTQIYTRRERERAVLVIYVQVTTCLCQVPPAAKRYDILGTPSSPPS